MKIKRTRNLTLGRMATIKATKNSDPWGGCGENTSTLLEEMLTSEARVEIRMNSSEE